MIHACAQVCVGHGGQEPGVTGQRTGSESGGVLASILHGQGDSAEGPANVGDRGPTIGWASVFWNSQSSPWNSASGPRGGGRGVCPPGWPGNTLRQKTLTPTPTIDPGTHGCPGSHLRAAAPRTGPAGRKGGASARGPHPPGGQSVQGGVWSAAGEGDGQAGQRPRLWVRSPAASLGSSGAAPQGQEEKQPAAAVPPEGPAVPAPGRAGRARRASPPPGVREEGRRAGRASLAETGPAPALP